MTPLIEVPGIGWDFEKGTDAKTIDEHLAPFAKRVEQNWGDTPCFVDLNPNVLDSSERMSDGRQAVEYVFAELRERDCSAIPVTGCERAPQYQRAVRSIARTDQRGVCLRLSLRQAASGDTEDLIRTLLAQLQGKPENTDLILDLDAPANFNPIEGFVKLLLATIRRLPHRNKWRTFTLMGTSFPETMGVIRSGFELLPRHEWIVWKRLVQELTLAKLRLLAFGDYAISHPAVLHVDMRIVKPAASLRYTVDDAWYILKGRNVREHGFKQYHRLCEEVASSRHFAQRAMSEGDAYIEDCARKKARTGNLTTWRWVGTNHHIEKVVRDLANYFAP
jgi:hypothetical protein